MMSTYSSQSASDARKRRADKVMQNIVPGYLLQESDKVEPTSQTKEVSTSEKVKVIIGLQLEKNKKEEIVKFLQRNINIFVEHSNTSKGID